jgi:hypothetical protein
VLIDEEDGSVIGELSEGYQVVETGVKPGSKGRHRMATGVRPGQLG